MGESRCGGETPMTVVYSSDDNYAYLTAVSALSVLKHDPGAKIIVLGYALGGALREMIRRTVESNGGVFEYSDIGRKLEKFKESSYSPYTSYAAYSRIFIPDVVEEGRVLYLDCDTLVNAPLNELFKFDMKGLPVALSGDVVSSSYLEYINLPEGASYFNTGVMLMDVESWREHSCFERIVAELENPGGPNPLGDQDIIARSLSGMISHLPPKWNFLSQYFMHSYDAIARISGKRFPIVFSRQEYEQALLSPAIYHFSGNTLGRPWQKGSHHPARRRFYSIAKEAGLYSKVMRNTRIPLAYEIQYLLYRILPKNLYGRVSRIILRLHIYLTYGRA